MIFQKKTTTKSKLMLNGALQVFRRPITLTIELLVEQKKKIKNKNGQHSFGRLNLEVKYRFGGSDIG